MTAYKCNRCSTLFEPAPGCLSLDVRVSGAADPAVKSSWLNVDLCEKCSPPVLELLKPALTGYTGA